MSTFSKLPRKTIHEILSYLYCHSERGGLRTLSALARTCRFLQDPALELLWDTISSIEPLLHSLPEDLCINTGTDRVTFIRESTSSDFQRAVLYAAKVKRIKYDIGGKARSIRAIPEAIWCAFYDHAPKPLFPNLRYLHCGTLSLFRNSSALRAVRILFGPRLVSVTMAITEAALPERESSRVSRVIRSLASASPYLAHLKFHQDVFGVRSVIGLFMGLEHLVTFDAPDIELSPSALAHLSTLPHLQKLVMSIGSSPQSLASLCSGFNPKPYRALVSLNVRTYSFGWCTPFLEMISSSYLRDFELSTSARRFEVVDGPKFKALCRALKKHTSLQLIVIHPGSVETSQDREPDNILPDALSPLLALQELNTLQISGWCEVLLDDAMLDAMSRAWPNIRGLYLHSWSREKEHYINDNPRFAMQATLAGLVPLALRCQHLERLVIALKIQVPSSLCDERLALTSVRPVQRAPRLKHLHLGRGSDTPEAMLIAGFLTDAFPKVTRIQPWINWMDVNNYLGVLSIVKTQERMGAIRLGNAAEVERAAIARVQRDLDRDRLELLHLRNDSLDIETILASMKI